MAVVTAAVAEEPFINPEDVEVLFTAAPPHVTIELCRCEDGSNVERPIEFIVDGNVADAEIVVFGFTMSFERLICASKPVNDSLKGTTKGDDDGWFSEVVQAFNKGIDDSDEVVVVGEVNSNKKRKSSNSSVMKNLNVEGEPEKISGFLKFIFAILNVHGVWRCPFQPAEAPPLSCAVSARSGDEISLYYLFALFLEFKCAQRMFFSKLQCHCDMRAPCCYWSSGISNTDHCHATNKEEIWRTLRNSFSAYCPFSFYSNAPT
ncbi:hypothetical protein GQ457_01G051710 [Hibiscus cannabinus]